MLHIGIVACSAEGAALCYQEICQESFRRFGAHRHPRITMDAIPLAEWMPAFESGDDVAIAEIMARSARVLADAGCDFLICPDNSAHRALAHLVDRSPLPWLSIADVVAADAAAHGFRRVGILGTLFTMRGTVYPRAFGAVGIECVLPGDDDQVLVDRIIFDELLAAQFTAGSREAFVEVIRRLAGVGCEAVALVCTEIPLLVTAQDSPLPVLDSTRLLAHAAVGRAATTGTAVGDDPPTG